MIGLQALSAAPLSALVEVAPVGVYRAGSDIAVAGWTASTSGALYAALDEAAPDDADYVRSPVLDAAVPAVFGLGATLPAGTWRVRVRARRTDSTGRTRVQLLDGSGTPLGASAWATLSPAFATYDLLVNTTGPSNRLQIEVAP